MNRRQFLKSCALAAGASALTGCIDAQPQSAAAQNIRPNIIYILADDMGYGDIQAYNPKSTIPTPGLNRLAEEGMRFTDAHSGSAVCTPTRYGVLTGRYCWRTRLKSGVLGGSSPHLIDPDRLTVAKIMKQAGYHTACIGKWHLGMDLPTQKGTKNKIDYSKPIQNGPLVNGFDTFYGVTASLDMPPYVFVANDRFTQPATERFPGAGFPAYSRPGDIAPGFDHSKALDQLTDKAVGYIEERAASQQPFFLYFPLTAPHKPCLPEERYRGRSGIGPYGDFVIQVDDVVGRIDRTLEKLNIKDDTLVFYTSDNGSYMFRQKDKDDHVKKPSVQGYHPSVHQPNAQWRGTKADIWEAGHRVPFLVRWPGQIKAGTTCAETICLTDLTATCADLTQQTLPETAAEDSFSLLGLLEEKPSHPSRPPVIHHSINGTFSLRDGKWKMVFGNGSGGRERPAGRSFKKPYTLFDLENDPAETTNVIEQHPEIAQRLTEKLEAIRQSGRSRK